MICWGHLQVLGTHEVADVEDGMGTFLQNLEEI